MASIASIRDYFTAGRLSELSSVLQENRWYVAGVAAAGSVLWWAVRRPRNLPPGPRGWPFLGAVGEVGQDMHEDCVRLGKKYGDIISFTLMGK